MRRAAVVGSAFLIAVALAGVLFGGQDNDEENSDDPNPGPPQTFVLDADAGGVVLSKSGRLVGVAANGDVKWSLPSKGDDPLAVCLESCPQAEVGFARSLRDPPELPDGPRLRLGPPSWRPVTVGPRLRVDRPLLGGPVPLRVTVDRAGAKPTLRIARGRSVPVPGTDVGGYQAADRRTGLLGDFAGGRGQQTMVLRQQAGGWSVAAQRRLSPPGDSTCISPDGTRIGLVGQGPPRVAMVVDGRIGNPRTITGVRREEANAGACALGGDTVATAVLSTGGQGGGRAVIRVHAGRRVHTLSLRPSGGPFYDLWVSPRTGTTAVRIGPEVRLIDPDGQVKTLPAEVATVSAPGKLLLIPRRGRARTRRF